MTKGTFDLLALLLTPLFWGGLLYGLWQVKRRV